MTVFSKFMLRLLLKNLRDSEALCQIQILPKSLDSLRWREWNDKLSKSLSAESIQTTLTTSLALL